MGNSTIVVIEGNRADSERIFSAITAASGGAKLERPFVQCDATFMKNVRRTTQEILAKHPKINYLIMSPGFSTLSGRDETQEGIEKKLAVHYYARWKSINDHIPGLKRASEAGEKVAVISVFAAGRGGGPIDLNDLGLVKGFQAFAEQVPTIPFIHAYPGFVRTNYLASSPSALVHAFAVLTMTPFSIDSTTSGEYMLHGIYERANKPGAWRTGALGEDLKDKSYYEDDNQWKKVWEHTVEVMKRLSRHLTPNN